MSEKRRDKKGRLLRAGEYQRKDGKYEYKYVDVDGNRKSIYSWQLVSTDKVPNGKKSEIALRDAIPIIQKEIQDGVLCSKHITFEQKFYEYVMAKKKLKPSTKAQYLLRYNAHIKPHIGDLPVDKITTSKITRLYEELLYDKKIAYSTFRGVDALIHNVFKALIADNYVIKDPAVKAYTDVMKDYEHDIPKERNSLTADQQNRFLDYLRCYHNQTFADLAIVMMGTGCRVGELISLTWNQCDFETGMITIDHSMSYYKDETGKYTQHILKPKTRSSIRDIPMITMVREALLRVKTTSSENFNVVIDGYSSFVFLNSKGVPYSDHDIVKFFINAVNKFNRIETITAGKENRSPNLLPRITAHNLRHTFCTRLCENETNLKVIQSIMGHSNIRTTMEVYNHATLEKKIDGMKKIEEVFMK